MTKSGGARPTARNRWRGVGVPLETSLRGTEHALALLIIGVRLGTLVQMAPSLPQGVAESPHPGWYLLCWIAAAVTTVAVSFITFRQGRPPSGRVWAVDLSVAVAITLIGSWTVTDTFRIGSWVSPFPSYLLSVAMTGAGLLIARSVFIAVLAIIVAAQLIYSAPSWDSASAATIIGNALTLVVLPSVGRWIYQYLRRVATDGDRARAEARELGRREEARRAQVAIHNGAAVIKMLSDPTIDPETRRLLEAEARLESARIQSYLRGRGTADDPFAGSESVSLSAVVAATSDRFLDLPLHAMLDLAEGTFIPATTAAPLDRALASLLLNIRDHADAETVVVHADADADDWTVTVHDDGVGFSVDPDTLGVGLREVVIGELARHDITADVESTPGIGTTVTLRGTAGQ